MSHVFKTTTLGNHNDVDDNVSNAKLNIVARNDTSSLENVHIDKQKGRHPSAYYGTFIDLFLAMNARCVTYGVGYYALLATKISGTYCKRRYQNVVWDYKRDNFDYDQDEQCGNDV
jgi:hypothetical protein